MVLSKVRPSASFDKRLNRVGIEIQRSVLSRYAVFLCEYVTMDHLPMHEQRTSLTMFADSQVILEEMCTRNNLTSPFMFTSSATHCHEFTYSKVGTAL
ncbi:hypothetical protein AcV5_003278 [Taiwanofungus camphoratus]|nr:hypothetical protein AcV5_003278 [Antrodia cinnamomea]